MTHRHTPGPWEVEENSSPPLVWGNDYEKPIAEVELHRSYANYADGEAQANAQLIADAPELLDVCQELLGPMIVWSQYWASTYNRGAISPAHEEIIQRASVVIARNTPNEDTE